MAHLQYMPGDPRLVDQLVYELKSKGIFDQFRKECIADVDTRPAYQNLRQRVESSVTTFLARQCWKPDLNKNQLREKLRKHILDGNYLEQGVERIVDQVVNPKVASVFIPQVEDLVYNYLGITRKKTPVEGPEKTVDLLPTDLEAVSPGSVRSNDDKEDISMDIDSNTAEKMDLDIEKSKEIIEIIDDKKDDQNSITEILSSNESDISIDKSSIPLPSEEIKLENIPEPENSPPKAGVVELEKIALPREPVPSTDIPLPEETMQKESNFKPILLHSEDSNSSSDSSLRRNMSPLTPIRNYNNENSYDAQQAFETDAKANDKEPSSFRFTIESENSSDSKKKEPEQTELAYQFNNQVNINSFNTPLYDDSSNSNNLRIDYESDANSKAVVDTKPEAENTEERKEKKDDRKSHKSSHRSRDSHRHSSSKNKRSDSKHSNSRDGSKHEKKSSSKDDHKKSSKDSRERSKDRGDKKENRESSKYRSSKSSSHKDSKSYRSSSSSHKHSGKTSDDKKISSSSHREKDKESKDKSKDRSKDSRSSTHRSEKDRKSSSSKKSDEKDKKKDKKDVDDHYSHSGRGNHGRRSTDRDSNDGSSSSKGSHNQNGSKGSDKKGCSKSSSSKSDNTSTASGDTSSPSDKDQKLQDNQLSQFKPAVRVDNHLETPIATPPRLPFVPDITLKKPKFAANLAEAKQMMKMRKFLDEEQKRMNQEAALLLEFQANVRPSLSQVYSSIPGPELEFACGANTIVNPPQSIIEPVNENLDNSDELDNKEVIQPEPQSVQQIFDIIFGNPSEIEISDQKNIETYDENKPFSKLVEEISEYSRASENKAKLDKINDQQEDTKPKNNINNSADNFEVNIVTEKLSEIIEITDIEKKLETKKDGIFDEIESPPYEDITENTDVTQNETDIANLEENKVGDDENKKELSVEKDPLKIDGIEKQTEMPEIDKDIKTIVKDNQLITEEPIELEESIENIKECIENEIVELNTKGKHIISDQSLNYLDSEEKAGNKKEISDNFSIENDKILNISEVETTYANKEKIVPKIVWQKSQENQIAEMVKIDDNKAMTSEIVPLKEENEISEVIPTNVSKDQEVPEIVELNTSNNSKVAENVSQNTTKNIGEKTLLHANKEKENPVIEPHNDRNDLKTTLLSPKNDTKRNEHDTQMPVIDIEDELKSHEFLKYFTNEEKLTAQSESDNVSKFFKSYTKFTSKIYLINCDTYEENIIKEVAKNYGHFEIVNYFKNGHSQVPKKTKNIVKDIRLSQEVTLPTKTIFSPTKSECSFELSSDYDAKLDEIVNKKSRQEVMEIILGVGGDESSKTLNENEIGEEKNMKRKVEVESSDIDKRSILTPTKLRKLSDSDQISSTTEETEEITSNNNKVQIATSTRSKYLGRAKRVGLSKPKRCNLVNSPSSDKSVENYVQNTPPAPLNGKIKSTPRSKVQRYDTSDLYKPKLHYLSRRNNIT